MNTKNVAKIIINCCKVLLEKKDSYGIVWVLCEIFIPVHRRRGENAQQIIDQAAQSKEHENKIKQLQDSLEISGKVKIFMVLLVYLAF